jgi:hypothetical protein
LPDKVGKLHGVVVPLPDEVLKLLEVFKAPEFAVMPEASKLPDKAVAVPATEKLPDLVMQPEKFPGMAVKPLYVAHLPEVASWFDVVLLPDQVVPLSGPALCPVVKAPESAKLHDMVMQPEKPPDKVAEPLVAVYSPGVPQLVKKLPDKAEVFRTAHMPDGVWLPGGPKRRRHAARCGRGAGRGRPVVLPPEQLPDEVVKSLYAVYSSEVSSSPEAVLLPDQVVHLPEVDKAPESAKLHDKVMQPEKLTDKVVKPLGFVNSPEVPPVPALPPAEAAQLPDTVMEIIADFVLPGVVMQKLPDKVVEVKPLSPAKLHDMVMQPEMVPDMVVKPLVFVYSPEVPQQPVPASPLEVGKFSGFAKLHDMVMQPEQLPDKVVKPPVVVHAPEGPQQAVPVLPPEVVEYPVPAMLPDMVMQPEQFLDKVVKPLFAVHVAKLHEGARPPEVLEPPVLVPSVEEPVVAVPLPRFAKLHEGARPPEVMFGAVELRRMKASRAAAAWAALGLSRRYEVAALEVFGAFYFLGEL